MPITAFPGVAVAGRILGEDGSPVVRALVGAKDQQRPWTRTDREGRFRLGGVDPWPVISVWPGADRVIREWTFVAPPEGVERTFVLREEAEVVPLRVRVAGADGTPAAGVRVGAVRESDGLVATAFTDDEGAAVLPVPPGEYRLLADGEFGPWGRHESSCSVVPGGDPDVTLVVLRNPTVRIDASPLFALPEDSGTIVALTSRRGFQKVDPKALHGTDLPVPSDDPTVVVVAVSEGGERMIRRIPLPDPADIGEETTLVLDSFPVTRVRARLLGPDGGPVRGVLRILRHRDEGASWLSWESRDDSQATPEVTTRRIGSLASLVTPEDGRLMAVTGEFGVPERGGTIDLGPIRLAARPKPMLRVRVPPGVEPPEDRAVQVDQRGSGTRTTAEIVDGVATFRTLPWTGRDEEIWLTIDESNVIPLVRRLEGPPPWEITWPTASLRLRVTDRQGKPLEYATVIVDGEVFEWKFQAATEFAVVGIEAGRHTVVVGETGHQAKVLRLDVREAEPRTLTIELSPREE